MIALAAAELDIDELERRLELAPAVAAPPGWCSRDQCTYDCLSVCNLAGG
ncbi:MAG TPA: hypothetical protein VIV40_37675 [Kofleriaceae bacterium]